MFTKETMLLDAFQTEGVNTEAMQNILASFGLHCLGCILSHGENIEQAAMAHGLDPQTMVDALNEAAIS
ncbi:MAG: DUF1858 domain-containing protein [Clostridia bacterium]